MRILVLTMLIAAFVLGTAYAESDVNLWIPHHMIKNQTYNGAIIVPEATPEGSLVFLSSDNDSVAQVPDSVTILPYQNHGIFPITPKGEGTAEIFATHEGKLYGASTQIFSPKSEPSHLKIILPANKTKTDSMLAYVTIHDDNNSPSPAREHLTVRISTSESIDAPNQITIRNDTTMTRFEMDVGGSGHIIASADGLNPDRTDITKTQNEFVVKVAVAPEIAMPDSYVFYYVWIEKDGKPFRPPYVIDVFVNSGSPDIGRFEINPTVASDGILVRLVDGVAHGILYTGHRGQTIITANIPEFGSAQDLLFVGHARFTNPDKDLTIRLEEQNFADSFNEEYEPNTILAWIYPTITDSRAWGIAATYHINRTENLEMTINDSGVERHDIIQNALIIPADAEELIYVSSGHGLEHEGVYDVTEHITKTNAIEFEINGASHGNYTVSASAGGMASAEARVEVIPRYAGEFELLITPIPALPHTLQDIAMVSVIDETGSLVDAKKVFGISTQFLISSDADISDDVITPAYSGTGAIRGILSDSSHITAIMDGVASDDIDVLPAGIAKSIELLAPTQVHVGEQFPFAVHEIDSLGIPIRKNSDWKISSPLGILVTGDYLEVGKSGDAKASIISSVGASEHDLSGFENIMNVAINLAKNSFRIGEELVLDIQNTVDASYELITNYPFKQTDSDTFVVTFDKEDESSTITVLATRDGFNSVSISEIVNVQKIFAIDARITSLDGKRLTMPFDVTIGDEHILATSPYYTEFEPIQVTIKFPEQSTVNNQGYAFEKIRINGMDSYNSIIETFPAQDIMVTAVYAAEILISVNDGEGSGVYRHGDIVRISAPDRDRLSFLIRDVFDHWEGIDASSSRAEFTADTDRNITAVYREDYTYLMGAVIVPLLGASFIAIFKNTAGFRWTIINMLERIVALAGTRPTKKYKPAKNTKDHA